MPVLRLFLSSATSCLPYRCAGSRRWTKWAVYFYTGELWPLSTNAAVGQLVLRNTASECRHRGAPLAAEEQQVPLASFRVSSRTTLMACRYHMQSENLAHAQTHESTFPEKEGSSLCLTVARLWKSLL